jgi:hypothetical protein
MTSSGWDYTQVPRSEFRVSDTLSASFKVLSRHIFAFPAVAASIWVLIIAMAAGVILALFGTGVLDSKLTPEQISPELIVLFVILGFAAIILIIVMNLVTQALLVHATFQELRGRPVRLGQSAAYAFGRTGPLLLLALIVSIGQMLGFLLFIIPFFILMTIWSMAVPVCILERRGPISSLGRSVELTQGNRWKLFGVIMLTGIAENMITNVTAEAASALAGGAGEIVILLIVLGLVQAFSSIFYAVAYRDLRRVKDGVDTEQIASVFD